jgi:uncharacterized membrane protein YhdT
MTAIGFALLFTAFCVTNLDDFFDLPVWLEALCGFMVIVGVVSAGAGVAVWLWEVMP